MKKKYKNILKKLYKSIPYKDKLFIWVRATGIANNTIYKKLNFNGIFSFKIDLKKVKIYNTGGTIENEIFWKGLGCTWEKETIWIWKLLSKKSNTILDVGANTGIYSLVAKTINPSARVIAFEPSTKTYNTLVRNCNINKYDVVTEKIALSNSTGHSTFYDVFEDNQTSASLSPDKLKRFSSYKGEINEYLVETMTLSDYISRNGIAKVDLIKIDVELHEPEVIEGLNEYLLRHNPVIILEILTDEIAVKINRLFNDSGYLIFHLDDIEKMHQVEKVAVIHKKWNYLLCPPMVVEEYELKKYIKD